MLLDLLVSKDGYKMFVYIKEYVNTNIILYLRLQILKFLQKVHQVLQLKQILKMNVDLLVLMVLMMILLGHMLILHFQVHIPWNVGFMLEKLVLNI